jgi:Family of unknown function (DUF6152)
MKPTWAILTMAAGLLGAGTPALAHHSFSAEYDSQKPVTISGKVIRHDWINPHSWIRLEVTNEKGEVEEWSCEALPPNGLYRQGWRKDTLKPGMEISVEGFLAKDGSHTMWSRAITTADGRRLFAGPAQRDE